MAEQVKLALEAIGLEEQGRRSVWVMALFGKGAPRLTLLRLGSGCALSLSK